MSISDISTILIIGILIICIPISIQMKWYGVAVWKSLIISLTMAVTGLYSCRLWFFLENGYWMGRSFFGAIFFAPITLLIMAKVMRLEYKYALDFCAPAGCLIFAILKIECLIGGCCQGVPLYINENREYVLFPSAAVEFVTALVLSVILIFASKKIKYRGKMYPITMVSYGILRFVLNLFRDDWGRTRKMGLPLPLGNIWSLISIAIGIAWLFIINKRSTVQNIEG